MTQRSLISTASRLVRPGHTLNTRKFHSAEYKNSFLTFLESGIRAAIRSFGASRVLAEEVRSTDAATYTVPSNVTDFGGYWRKGDLKSITESDIENAPALRALHSRLKLELLVPLTTLARTLICQSANSKYADNLAMATFGRNLLNFYVYEYFMVKYPRLTPTVLQKTTDLYLSTKSLSDIALSWGVEEDSRSALSRYLSDEHEEEQLFGRLRYSPSSAKRENGVVELLSGQEIFAGRNGALSTFARALVAGIYTHAGLDETRQFIHDYVIKPKKIDLSSMLIFDQPTRELSRLCAREGLQSPTSRLLVETGRYTSHPVFVVGVFSGEQKLGEGQGASLVESKTRAAVNALKSWYLYSPLDSALPSDASSEAGDFGGVYIDKGSVIV